MLKKKLILSLLLMASFQFIQAQTSVNSSGGDVDGDSGSYSYSVGQTSYIAIEATSSFASLIQGVQVPYEYYNHYCPADINQDGLVDVIDFLELNSAFGNTCVCRADIDRSGVVDVLDFLEFNSAFGSICPTGG
jgi:hypothetical protein